MDRLGCNAMGPVVKPRGGASFVKHPYARRPLSSIGLPFQSDLPEYCCAVKVALNSVRH